jgi:hypothetical protein
VTTGVDFLASPQIAVVEYLKCPWNGIDITHLAIRS